MNKSEIELKNVESIMNDMPFAERALCVQMIASLMASIGHPVHGQIFSIAVAHVNCQVAVFNIKMGLVNKDGSTPEHPLGGDGKVENINTAFVARKPVSMADMRKRYEEEKPSVEGCFSPDSDSGKGAFHTGGYNGDVPRETVNVVSLEFAPLTDEQASALAAFVEKGSKETKH